MTRRLTAMRHRLDAVKARTGTRELQVKRRERTKQLIELGGLVVKAGLVELADDDRAMLYGAFLWMAGKLRSDDGAHAAGLWQRKGRRAFAIAKPIWDDDAGGGEKTITEDIFDTTER